MMRLVFVSLAISIVSVFLGCLGESPVRRFGEYSMAELEAFVAEDAKQTVGLELVNFKLDPMVENGRFVGSCVNGDGLPFQVEVTQEPNRITWKAVHKEMTFYGSKSR